jgi:predicted Rossmann fold flavoprotein
VVFRATEVGVDVKKIVVVGGGPAGMMAAIRASQLRQDVTLIEKNPTLGRKLLLSGKGRCNLTNTCDLETFLKRFSANGQFLRDAFKKFFNSDLINFFEERGLKLKVERQLRVFPTGDKAAIILNVLKGELRRNRVRLVFKATAKDISIADKKVKALLLQDSRVIPADKIILATGGVSYSFTGSKGEGLAIAQRLGHSIVGLRPGLVPLETTPCYNALEGLSLKNIRIIFSDGQRKISSDIGEMLFTNFGISGPLVLSLSGVVVDWLKRKGRVIAQIDLKPALTRDQLNARLLREFSVQGKKDLKNALRSLLPASLVSIFIKNTGIHPEKKVNQVSQQERQRIIALLKGFNLVITAARPIEEAMITRGGVSLKEVNPRTMESRLIKGLFFAGEILDIDADTGGFNLQAAFSTGYLAGDN